MGGKACFVPYTSSNLPGLCSQALLAAGLPRQCPLQKYLVPTPQRIHGPWTVADLLNYKAL